MIRKKNGGKADSLNAGINAARYPWFICMDADSILQHDSLEKIVRPVLEDENVIAVGGSVRPANGVVIKRSCDKIQAAQKYNSKNAIPGICPFFSGSTYSAG